MLAPYSFADVACAFAGAFGSFSIGAGVGAAEEGISIEAVEDANILTTGADGQGMHSQVMSTARNITVRLLKTSPANAQLMNAYKAERQSRLSYGKSVITLSDAIRGDFIVLRGVAFVRVPNLTFAKEAGTNEWMFVAAESEETLGIGQPEL